MSEDTQQQRPTDNRKERKKTDYQYTAFDLDMIVCAKNGHVVDFTFCTLFRIEKNGDETLGVSATILIVDKYFLKLSAPNDEGAQREFWLAKSMIATATPHKPPRRDRS